MSVRVFDYDEAGSVSEPQMGYRWDGREQRFVRPEGTEGPPERLVRAALFFTLCARRAYEAQDAELRALRDATAPYKMGADVPVDAERWREYRRLDARRARWQRLARLANERLEERALRAAQKVEGRAVEHRAAELQRAAGAEACNRLADLLPGERW